MLALYVILLLLAFRLRRARRTRHWLWLWRLWLLRLHSRSRLGFYLGPLRFWLWLRLRWLWLRRLGLDLRGGTRFNLGCWFGFDAWDRSWLHLRRWFRLDLRRRLGFHTRNRLGLDEWLFLGWERLGFHARYVWIHARRAGIDPWLPRLRFDLGVRLGSFDCWRWRFNATWPIDRLRIDGSLGKLRAIRLRGASRRIRRGIDCRGFQFLSFFPRGTEILPALTKLLTFFLGQRLVANCAILALDHVSQWRGNDKALLFVRQIARGASLLIFPSAWWSSRFVVMAILIIGLDLASPLLIVAIGPALLRIEGIVA